MKSFSSNQELSKVFEPFTADQSGRARGGESAKYHSHGMAMSIARQLVELHGGKMGIESRFVSTCVHA